MAELDHVGDLILFTMGRTTVTLGGIVAGAAVFAAALIAARLAVTGIRRLRSRSQGGRQALYIVERLTTYGLTIIGLVVGLSVVGLDLSSLAIFAGAIGVGVGLGLQGVVREFVSGLVLIFDRVLNVGDYVELEDGKRGRVQQIGPRAVHILTNDNIDVIVPNSKFIDGPVVNWTLRDRTSRIHIPFSVAYGSDRTKVREAVLAAASSVPFTMPESDERKSQVWLTAFGDSGLEFELLVWPTLEAVKRPAAMRAAYNWAIADALDQAGVEIPFPQTDLRIRSFFGREGDEALRVLKMDAPATPRATVARATGVNDAAEDLARPLPPDSDGDEPPPGASKA